MACYDKPLGVSQTSSDRTDQLGRRNYQKEMLLPPPSDLDNNIHRNLYFVVYFEIQELHIDGTPRRLVKGSFYSRSMPFTDAMDENRSKWSIARWM